MSKIMVNIEVLNTSEIIQTRKGKVFHWLAQRIKSPDALRSAIEKRISRDVINGIKVSLDQRFKEEGIAGRLKISMVE